MAEELGGASLVRGWIHSLGEIIFPSRCACCMTYLDSDDSIICTKCRFDMPLTSYYYRKDNYVVELFAGRVDFSTASALMYFRYGTHYHKMIHRMKYSGRDDIARVLGRIYGFYLMRSPFYNDLDIVVPVPLHYSKMIRRGYNQAGEFAKGIAESLKIEYKPFLLKRSKKTRTQAQLKSKESRAGNVDGAFRVVRPELYRSKKILLVDDVITTGATLESCAEALNKQIEDATLYIGALAVVAKIDKK